MPHTVQSLQLADLTIHRVVEMEGPFFATKTFFPTLSDAVLDENRA